MTFLYHACNAAAKQCTGCRVFFLFLRRSFGTLGRLTLMFRILMCAAVLYAFSNFGFAATVIAEEVKTDIIIEKNLFSPDRKKWVSEPASAKKSSDKLAKKEINDLILMGTAIRGKDRYAVLHAKKDATKAGFKPWMKGDYVQGYLLKEIEEKMVVLQDEAENKEYILYLNDEKKERVAEKTAVKVEQPAAVVDDVKEAQPGKRRSPRRTARQPSNSVDMQSPGGGAMGRNVQRGGGFGGAPSTETSDPGIQPSEGNDTRGN